MADIDREPPGALGLSNAEFEALRGTPFADAFHAIDFDWPDRPDGDPRRTPPAAGWARLIARISRAIHGGEM